jgi:hypothetical protein
MFVLESANAPISGNLTAAACISCLRQRDAQFATDTFEDEHKFSIGRESVEIRTANFHSENTDAIIYVPRRRFIVAVDTITPGDVPYANFGSTSKFAGYVAFFDEIVRYDFDSILTGHTAVLGTREDVVVNREYVHDVRDTALRGMKTMLPTFEQRFATLGHKNGNLAYRMAIETVRGDCTRQIIDRWKGRLSVVDVWAHTHCETVIQYAIMHQSHQARGHLLDHDRNTMEKGNRCRSIREDKLRPAQADAQCQPVRHVPMLDDPAVLKAENLHCLEFDSPSRCSNSAERALMRAVPANVNRNFVTLRDHVQNLATRIRKAC